MRRIELSWVAEGSEGTVLHPPTRSIRWLKAGQLAMPLQSSEGIHYQIVRFVFSRGPRQLSNRPAHPVKYYLPSVFFMNTLILHIQKILQEEFIDLYPSLFM